MEQLLKEELERIEKLPEGTRSAAYLKLIIIQLAEIRKLLGGT